ncbi:hypothetical protein HanIR_Chr08g0358791 [Helianthus annuus]|nr:hypothetical protein HanIR_Chr08g0358791 [Helianthus annuus]
MEERVAHESRWCCYTLLCLWSDIDLSWSFASQPKSRSTNNGNSRVAFFQRPTALSHQRLTRSMSQAPQMRLHDNYLSDIDLSWGSARQAKSTSVNSDNSRVPSFQRPTASSHRRLTRSMSQAPQMRRSHDDYVVRRVPTSTYLQPE